MLNINSERWIHISSGNGSVSKEEWQEIKNTKYINKPTGGLWLSKYNGQSHNVCEWLNYVQDQVSANGEYSSLYRMANEYKAGLIFEFTQNPNIAIIQNEEELKCFIDSFSLSSTSLDYEKIANIYDGLYLKLFGLPFKYWSEYQSDEFNFRTWGCNTLLIFNYDIIKSWTKIDIDASIDIDGFINYDISGHSKTYRKGIYERKGNN